MESFSEKVNNSGKNGLFLNWTTFWKVKVEKYGAAF